MNTKQTHRCRAATGQVNSTAPPNSGRRLAGAMNLYFRAGFIGIGLSSLYEHQADTLMQGWGRDLVRHLQNVLIDQLLDERVLHKTIRFRTRCRVLVRTASLMASVDRDWQNLSAAGAKFLGHGRNRQRALAADG